LLAKIPYLETWNNYRRLNHNFYRKFFIESKLTIEEERNSLTEHNFVVLPHREYVNDGIIDYHTFHQYSILIKRRDELKQFLSDNGIGSDIYYPVPLHKQKCFAEFKYDDNNFPNTNFVCEHILSLPIYPELSEQAIKATVNCIADFYFSK
jgi:dTDP-4-amino-4,6-dideoxygalactose transaminase